MNDGDALLAAIRQQPDEDVPRLAYADWLDETGSPARARFIRLQVEQTNGPGTYWNMTGSRRKPTPFMELLSVQPWADQRIMKAEAHLGYVQPSTSGSAVLWRRGFIAGVMCTPGNLVVYMERLAEHPVREIRLNERLKVQQVAALRPEWAVDGAQGWYGYRHADLCQDVIPLFQYPRFPGLIDAVYDPFRVGTQRSPFYLVGKKPVKE